MPSAGRNGFEGYKLRIPERCECEVIGDFGWGPMQEASNILIALSAVLLAIYLWYDTRHSD